MQLLFDFQQVVGEKRAEILIANLSRDEKLPQQIEGDLILEIGATKNEGFVFGLEQLKNGVSSLLHLLGQ